MANTPESKSGTCPRCGATLAGDELSGNCPRCLSALLLSPDTPEPAEVSATPVLRQLGDFELLEEVARGGMGVVFRARQRKLDRIVAVKVLRDAWLATPIQVKRFRAEAANAAKLKHPNIVAVHEVGEEGGQHFFAMDLIEGKNLAELTREGPLPPRQAAELAAKVAKAVQHAHQQGVLHRDIKPSNVLLDAKGEPHVTDFGLARPMDDESSLTLTGQVLGTPGYVAPEQAKGGGAVGPAADVYGLGALLYHLLTGRAPFVGASAAETLTQVLQQEPVSPRLLNPAVPVDLAAVCLKCLGKHPRERYGSASELAADLERFLGNETTHARPAGPLDRGARWCRRKPALAATAIALVVVGVAGLAGVVWQWRQAEAHRRRAEAGELSARQNAYAADMNNVQTALARHDLGRARELLDRYRPEGKPEIRNPISEREQEETEATESRQMNPSLFSPLSPVQKSTTPGHDLRGWEWRYFWKLARGDEQFLLCQYSDLIGALGFSPDGRQLVLRGEREGVVVWDFVARKLIARTPAVGSGQSLAVSPVGSLAAFADADKDGSPVARLWDYAAGRDADSLPLPGNAPRFAFSPDGAALAILTADGFVHVCEIASRRFLARLPVLQVFSAKLQFAPGGRWLAISQRGLVLLWNWESGQRRELPLPSATVDATALAWSGDGRYLAAGCSAPDAPVFVWDLSDCADLASTPELPQPFQLTGHRHLVQGLAFSPDGKTLASAGVDQTLRVWGLENRRERRCLRGHLHELRAVAFSPDGKQLASCGLDGTVRVWDPAPAAPAHVESYKVLPIPLPLGGCAFSPDSQSFIALDSRDGSAALWDTTTLQEREKLAFLGTNHVAVAWAADGDTVALSDRGGNLRIWDLPKRRPVTDCVRNDTVAGELRFSGQHTLLGLLALGRPGDLRPFIRLVRLWDTRDWREIAVPLDALNDLMDAAVSPDGRTLVAASAGGRVAWWDLSSGRCLARFENRFTRSDAYVRFSPDGRMAAIGESKGVITLWDAVARQEMAKVRGNLRTVGGVAFTPDGRRLLTSGADDEDAVRLLDLGSQRYLAGLSAPVDRYLFITMSPDASTLVAVGFNGTAVFWQAPSWAEIARWENQQADAR